MNRLLAVVAAGTLAAPAMAQLSINWSTIDGGGGTSTGGTFTLSGTIGQPDAGAVMTGGTFTLSGGFWPGASATARCGPSDISSPGQVLGSDGELTADDIIVFLNAFFAGNQAIANVSGPGQNTVVLDAELTADDIIVFLNRFFAGC